MQDKAVLLLSGGPDSAVALYDAKARGIEVSALTLVNDERGTNRVEVVCAQTLAKRLRVRHTLVDLSCLGAMFSDRLTTKFAVGGSVNNCVAPGLVAAPLGVELMHIAAMMYAVSHGIENVIWSIHADDVKYEELKQTTDYLILMQNLARLRAGTFCKIKTPFIAMSKVEVLTLGAKLGTPFHLTFSCSVNDTDKACGICPQCLKRQSAFRLAGITDPATKDYSWGVDQSTAKWAEHLSL